MAYFLKHLEASIGGTTQLSRRALCGQVTHIEPDVVAYVEINRLALLVHCFSHTSLSFLNGGACVFKSFATAACVGIGSRWNKPGVLSLDSRY